MVISILDNQYDISIFPNQLQNSLIEFSSKDLLSFSDDEYYDLCQDLHKIALNSEEWDESEDNCLTDYDHQVQLILEGEPLS